MPSNNCIFRCCVVLLFISITLTQISKIHSICTQTLCDVSLCPNPMECLHGITDDECFCCKVCLKQKGETCGPNIGKCAKGLQCLSSQHLDPVITNLVINDKQIGICGALNCTGVKCQAIGDNDNIKCQNDSYKLLSTRSDSCCQTSVFECQCLPGICNTSHPLCPHNTIARVVRAGNGKPGSCCDQIECIETPTKCTHNNRKYMNGNKWKADNCTTCECRDGLTFCQKKVCKEKTSVNCNAMAMSYDECCPTCQGCISSNGKFYNNTHNWYENDCTHCECTNGKISCKVQMCSPVHCDKPIIIAGQCCPICPTRSIYSCHLQCPQGYKHNSLGLEICECNDCLNKSFKCNLFCPFGFKRGSDGCETCQCLSVANESVSKTDETFCTVSNGSIIANGIYWHDGCGECFCISGKIMCTKPNCSPIKCSNAIIIDNQCCPVCASDQNKEVIDIDQKNGVIHSSHLSSHLFITAIILTLIITILLLGIFILLAIFILKKYPNIKYTRNRVINSSMKDNAIIHLWPYNKSSAQVPNVQEKQFIHIRVGNKNTNLLNNESLQIDNLGHSIEDRLLTNCSCAE